MPKPTTTSRILVIDGTSFPFGPETTVIPRESWRFQGIEQWIVLSVDFIVKSWNLVAEFGL